MRSEAERIAFIHGLIYGEMMTLGSVKHEAEAQVRTLIDCLIHQWISPAELIKGPREGAENWNREVDAAILTYDVQTDERLTVQGEKMKQSTPVIALCHFGLNPWDDCWWVISSFSQQVRVFDAPHFKCWNDGWLSIKEG